MEHLFYETHLSGGDNSKSSGQICSRASARPARALTQLDVAWHDAQDRFGDKSPVSGLHEVESLKRQVSRLAQLRRERDSYIKDLLADAKATHSRHEDELASALASRQALGERELQEQLS